MAADKFTQIEWLITHRIPCSKCGLGPSCCSDVCLAHKKWKAKFDELDISDAVYDEARAVRSVIDDLRKIENIRIEVDKKLMFDISDKVKDKFIYGVQINTY